MSFVSKLPKKLVIVFYLRRLFQLKKYSYLRPVHKNLLRIDFWLNRVKLADAIESTSTNLNWS